MTDHKFLHSVKQGTELAKTDSYRYFIVHLHHSCCFIQRTFMLKIEHIPGWQKCVLFVSLFIILVYYVKSVLHTWLKMCIVSHNRVKAQSAGAVKNVNATKIFFQESMICFAIVLYIWITAFSGEIWRLSVIEQCSLLRITVKCYQ